MPLPPQSKRPYSAVLSALRKMELIRLSIEFRLPTDGSVVGLRNRLKAYLNSNHDTLIQNPRYNPLFPRHRRARSPSPPRASILSMASPPLPNCSPSLAHSYESRHGIDDQLLDQPDVVPPHLDQPSVHPQEPLPPSPQLSPFPVTSLLSPGVHAPPDFPSAFQPLVPARQGVIVTQGFPHPIPPHPDRHSFFNVTDASNVVSSLAKGYVSRAIQNSWAESTLRKYSGTIKQFIQFCDNEQVPDHLRFPTDEFVLCAFAASSLGKHASSTPRSRLSALKAWHFTHNLEWKGSTRLRYVLNGVHNLAPGTSRRPPRPPVNANMLSQLVNGLDLSSLLDVAVAACAATAFWGQCRLGELLPSSLVPLPQTSYPSRADFKRSLHNPQSCILRLPRTKTHRHGQDVVLVDQRHPINPIALLKRHLRVNHVPDSSHIFSYTSAHGPSSLTKSLFLQRCNAIWQQLGYPRTTGHCFRIGGTTELLIAGTPPDIVRVTGRWSSESFLRYWRSLDDIAPQHVRNLHKLKHRRVRR